MNILVINGPNLNLLGVREPDLYGKQDYTALVALVEETCAQEGMEVEVFQSNHEGAIVDRIQAALGTADGIVINPAAYTHTSVAILDALKAVNPARGGGAHLRCLPAGGLPPGFLRRHGLCADLHGLGSGGLPKGHPFPEGLFAAPLTQKGKRPDCGKFHGLAVFLSCHGSAAIRRRM